MFFIGFFDRPIAVGIKGIVGFFKLGAVTPTLEGKHNLPTIPITRISHI
jgi:hypothetical protein